MRSRSRPERVLEQPALNDTPMLLRSRCFPHPRRVVLALVASTLLTACFPGRRLLRGTIERDGAVLVEALFDVADTASELEAPPADHEEARADLAAARSADHSLHDF